jgi:trehalose 6-phosphate synthase
VAVREEDGRWQATPSPGGLVTALAPTMRRTRGVWVGWPGCAPEAPAESVLAELTDRDYALTPVMLTEQELSGYYRGFAIKTLWPLFHDLLGQFSFDSDNWRTYCAVNRRFAETVAAQVQAEDFVWVHDYQLLLVGQYLRQMGIEHNLNFLLHIPFPSPDLFRRLPDNRTVIEALLAYDHDGFQTSLDRRNFVQCVKWFTPGAKRTSYRRRSVIRHNGRDVVVGYYPISIDFEDFDHDARSEAVTETTQALLGSFSTPCLMLGLDRLDYTKGIPERFRAFERALETYPELRGNLSLLQIVIPSRVGVPEYRELKEELDSLAGRINGRFAQRGWVPINYQFRSLTRTQLLAHYRACDIALVTPLRDGMNLISKEYCAARVDGQGVLILSEFAGSAQQLGRGATLVNPYDVDGMAVAIFQAYTMPATLRRQRMRLLRTEIRRTDVRWWLHWFLRESQVGAGVGRQSVNEAVS